MKGIPDADPHTHTHTHTHDYLRHASFSRNGLSPPTPSYFPPSPMSCARSAAAQPAGHTPFLPRPTQNPHSIRPYALTQTKRTRTHASASTYHNRSNARHCSPRLRHCALWDCRRASQNSTKKVVTATAAATAVVASVRVRTCVSVCVCALAQI